MRLAGRHTVRLCRLGRRGCGGFSLPELLIASTIFLLLVTAITSTSLYGLKSQAIIEPRLAAEDAARRLEGWMSSQIQQAQRVRVGTHDGAAFTEPAMGSPRQGNALELQVQTPGGAVNTLVYRVASGQLHCSTNGGTAGVQIGGLSNTQVFAEEDISGAVMSFPAERVTVAVRLQFNSVQMGTSALAVGAGQHFTVYELEFRATQRGG